MEQAELTELERLRLENIALKYNMLEQQKQALLGERTKVIQQIEDDHPGWKWSDQKAGLIQHIPPNKDQEAGS